MKTILFVCTGNTCRSPMAVGILRDAIGNRHKIKIISAGVIGMKGLPANSNAVKAMKEIGIDISGHRSQPLTKKLVDEAEKVFVMTQIHKLEVINLLEKSRKEIYLIGELNRKQVLKNKDIDISDPIGRGIEAYRNCRDQIRQCVPGIIGKIFEKRLKKKQK